MAEKYSINEFNKIAIIQTAFIGDVVLTLPLVDSIKSINKNAEILFVTTPQSAEIALMASNVNKVISYDKNGLNEGLRGIKLIAEILKENKVECIISPHRSLRSSLLTYYSRPDYSVTFNKTAFSFIYDKKIQYKISQHEIERNFSLLSAFSDNFEFIDLNKVKIDINDEDKDYIDSILINKLPKEKTLVLAPGSIWQTKRWLPEYFQKIIEYYQQNCNIVMIGSKNDIELCNLIANGTNALNMAGKTTFAQTLHLLSQSNLLLTNDSSPTHLAGLVNCPTLTIYGPTSPKYGFYPRSEKSLSMAKDDLKCHPCHIHGKNVCPIKTFDCMKTQLPNMVINQIDSLI